MKTANHEGMLRPRLANPSLQRAELRSLLQPFAQGQFYAEEEALGLLAGFSPSGDATMLLRELCDEGLLGRSGSNFWRSDFLRGEIGCGNARIRDLRPDDAPALKAIHESLKDYDDITLEPFSEADLKSILDKTDLPPGGSPEFFRAKMILAPDHSPAGYLVTYSGYSAPNMLWVGSLFLHRDCHRMGLGGAAMRAVEQEAARSGFERVGLGVYAMNTRGLQFWVGRGYDKIETVKVNGHGRAILRLVKAL
jgi:GNAT superfamily N-acetyltransferase